jgi:tetratricopeptide (TPR) repeat protein
VTDVRLSVVEDIAPSREDAAFALLRDRYSTITQILRIGVLHGGFTDASVLVCDISDSRPVGTADRIDGHYILKVSGAGAADQAAAHRDFHETLPDFANRRVPRLVTAVADDAVQAGLYEIAGPSLRSIRTADAVDYRDQRSICGEVASELLAAQLRAAGMPDYQTTVGKVLEEWVPGMFGDTSRREALLRVSAWVGAAEGLLFVHGGEHLPNPHRVWAPDRPLRTTDAAVFRGRCHGDLHLKNIVVTGSERTRNLTYWLIDLSWDRDAPLLYDQAYLEVSAYLNGIHQSSSPSPLPVFSTVDGVSLTSSLLLLPADQGILELIQQIRENTNDVLQRLEGRRRDVWDLQYPLARVAAGLNWAAKPTDQPGDDRLRSAAFLYAAWASKVLLLRYFPREWDELVQEHERRRPVDPAERLAGPPVPIAEAQKLFEPFLSAEDSGLDLYLVADEGMRHSRLVDLGHSRWGVVVDLDPSSDADGLSAALRPELHARRSVIDIGRTLPPDQPEATTIWLHANGWASRFEPRPQELAAWRRTYLPLIRKVIDRTARQTSNRAAAVLVLRSGQNDDKVERIVEYLDERYEGNVHLLDVGFAGRSGTPDIVSLLETLAPVLPAGGVMPEATIPGADGPVPLGPQDLLWLGVDLQVLHSALLAEAAHRDLESDEFWRGRPPTWVDLAAGLDVPREAYGELRRDAEKALTGANRPVLVELAHSPGAGGTTLARRLAWDLSTIHPTVVLKRYSTSTVERIEELQRRADRPLLLVVEAAELSDTDSDDLRTTLRERNIPVVELWVSRTNASPHSVTRDERLHRLLDPMPVGERREFARAYAPQAETPTGRDLITRLGSMDAIVTPIHPQQLSPFFFGLCAYERSFTGIERFVRHHVDRLTPEQRRVALFLGLVTRYAQIGIPIHLVRFWISGRWAHEASYQDADEDLRNLLGDDLRHIAVRHRSELRLMHPQIAEQVLQNLLGGDDPSTWRRNLPQLSVDLIDQVAGHLGSENRLTRRLLENLFIRRIRVEDTSRGGGSNFSELIMTMSRPSPAPAHYVLQQLTEHCPNEPHFWNHLGRHQIYEMKSSFELAERYLLRAVELSGHRDALHLHTLGQVRRLWLEHSVDAILTQKKPVGAQGLLDEVLSRFEAAIDAFEQARAAAPDSEYAYITPVQLILHVLERLVRVSGYESLPDLINADGGTSTSTWATEQLAAAEDLLDQYRTLRAGPYDPPDNRLFRSCEEAIERLYSNIDHLIQQWREQLDDTEESAATGRALARAYVRRENRDWSRMDERTLRTIADCLDQAIRVNHPSEADLRTWFQAYRRLPEYNEMRALERFSTIADLSDSLEASYYLYILHFMRWYRGEEHSQDRVRHHLEATRRLSRYANRQWSYEWLGQMPEWCPLAHYTELGTWREGFWSRPGPLNRVPGVVEEISGPKSGKIRIVPGRLTAFFLPGHKFRRGRDENAYVDFFLGFSYEGLRAWEVDLSGRWTPPARRPGLGDRAAPARPAIVLPEEVPGSPVPSSPSPTADLLVPGQSSVDSSPTPSQTVPARSPLPVAEPAATAADPATLIQELVNNASQIPLIDLGGLLISRFGQRRYDEFRAGRKLRDALEGLGYHTEQVGKVWVVGRPTE